MKVFVLQQFLGLLLIVLCCFGQVFTQEKTGLVKGEFLDVTYNMHQPYKDAAIIFKDKTGKIYSTKTRADGSFEILLIIGDHLYGTDVHGEVDLDFEFNPLSLITVKESNSFLQLHHFDDLMVEPTEIKDYKESKISVVVFTRPLIELPKVKINKIKHRRK